MGAYRLKDDQTTDAAGVIETASGAHVPPVPGNEAWDRYLAWKAVPNTADPATATAIEPYRKGAKARIDRAGEVEFAKDLRLQGPGSAALGFAHAALLEELYRYEADMSPSAANYPILDALVGEEGVDLAAVAAAIRTWWDGVSARVADTFAEVWKQHKAINGAADKAAVDAISASWPGGGGGE